MDSNKFKNHIDVLNLMPSKNTFLVYWGDIEKYFQSINAEKVLDVFAYNNGQIY
jgi:retron-type reverse transcriptase